MTEQEIENGNRLIAEFMGGKFSPNFNKWLGLDKNKFKVIRTVDLCYHSSWDWLMPVVEKIEGYDNYRVTIFRRCCDIEEVYALGDAIVEVTAKKTKIEATWLAVTTFIKYYNSQIKKQQEEVK